MGQPRRVAVVIVNYRTPELTQAAVASLAGELDPERDALRVVDNASGDGSAERLEGWLGERGFAGWAQVLRSPENRGFAAGNNLGLRSVEADLYLLLNSDAELRPGALAALLDAASRRPEVGLFGPRIEGPDGAPHMSAFRFHSPGGELIRSAATGALARLLRRWDVPPPPGDVAVEPEWLSFACVLVRRAVIESAGLLDEGYFLYFEDVDYCRRARQAGWRHALVPEARVLHLHGASSELPAREARRARRPGYFYDARARYFTKFYGRAGLLAANALWTLGRGVSLARERLEGRPTQACESEWLDIWLGRPGPG